LNKLSIKLPLTETIPAKPGDVLNIIVRSQGTLEVVFAIDPESAESQDDKFILYSTDDENTYYQEKTPLDNISNGKGTTKIRFNGLPKELNYSLGVDPGKEGDPYLIFENKPYGSWCENPVTEMTTEFKVKFHIDPNKGENANNRFILFSTDTAKSYHQEKTIKDDVTAGDDVTEIVFSDLNRDLCYSLQVDPGDKRKPYLVFENRTYADLSKKSV